jgi:hypothetical protein
MFSSPPSVNSICCEVELCSVDDTKDPGDETNRVLSDKLQCSSTAFSSNVIFSKSPGTKLFRSSFIMGPHYGPKNSFQPSDSLRPSSNRLKMMKSSRDFSFSATYVRSRPINMLPSFPGEILSGRTRIRLILGPLYHSRTHFSPKMWSQLSRTGNSESVCADPLVCP